MKRQIANIVTGCRILGSVWLLFVPVGTDLLWVLYLLCGLTDLVDGTIARKTNAANGFGTRLDSAADILFSAVALFKFLPVFRLSEWLWAWVAAIAVIRIGNQLWGFLREKRMVSLHTRANKLTGLILFLLPLTLSLIDLDTSVPVVCAIATGAALQEGYYIGTGREII